MELDFPRYQNELNDPKENKTNLHYDEDVTLVIVFSNVVKGLNIKGKGSAC